MKDRRTPAAQKKEKFLEAMAKCYSPRTAADRCKIGRRTVYDWYDNDEQFARAWDDVFETCVQKLEASMFERALNLKYPLATTAAIFLLKAMRPEVYRERYDVVDSTKSDEAIDKRIIELARKKGIALFAGGAGEARPGGEAQGNGNGAAKLA